MNDHLATGGTTRGLVPSGVHTARRQAGKWVGALTNPPQMREHLEGAPASPPPPANTQSRTQPEAQASRGGEETGDENRMPHQLKTITPQDRELAQGALTMLSFFSGANGSIGRNRMRVGPMRVRLREQR